MTVLWKKTENNNRIESDQVKFWYRLIFQVSNFSPLLRHCALSLHIVFWKIGLIWTSVAVNVWGVGGLCPLLFCIYILHYTFVHLFGLGNLLLRLIFNLLYHLSYSPLCYARIILNAFKYTHTHAYVTIYTCMNAIYSQMSCLVSQTYWRQHAILINNQV